MSHFLLPHGTGNPDAKIFILKDAPTFDEIKRQEFLSDTGGAEFKKMLLEAGITTTEIFTSSVSKGTLIGTIDSYFTDKASKGKLIVGGVRHGSLWIKQSILDGWNNVAEEIDRVKPNIIVPTGPIGLHFLRGESSIATWRGSVNWSDAVNRKVIPTYDSAMIMKVWNWRYHAVRDLQRVAYEAQKPTIDDPGYKFEIAPSFTQVMARLQTLINEAERRKQADQKLDA